MTDAVTAASIAALASTAGAVVGLLNNRAQAMARTSAELAVQAARTQMQEIHILVNSGMAKALADFAGAQEEIRTLRELVTQLSKRLDPQE